MGISRVSRPGSRGEGMTRSDVPLDELGKWEAMPGDGGEAWRGEVGLGLPLPSPVTGSSPSSSFPPSIQAFPPRSRWGPHSPLSPALCPAAHCDLAGVKTQGLTGREAGVGLFSNLGKLGPSPLLSLERNNLPFPPSVPSGHPGN